jgi:hypothetical protein
MSEITDKIRWPALMRGQVLSAAVNKYARLIQLVDKKAQVMIFLNSILIPVCFNGLDNPIFQYACMVSIATACISILASIICIYPKRRRRKIGDENINYLHFNDIGHLEREEYMNAFVPILSDPERLTKAAVHDLYDTAKNSILPKYYWIKIAYGTFFVGNLLAIIMIAVSIELSLLS